jgi:hypothetical protein
VSAVFKNVQVSVTLPSSGVHIDQQNFRFNDLSFYGNQTPNVI